MSGYGSASKLVGVWNDSTDEGDEGFDEVYVVIDAEGFYSIYDYAGDTYDNWGNCYWIEANAARLSALGNNRYSLALSDPDEEHETLIITVSGDTLTMRGVNDEPEDAFSMVRSSRKVSSFTPECSDSFTEARRLVPAKGIKSAVNPLLGK